MKILKVTTFKYFFEKNKTLKKIVNYEKNYKPFCVDIFEYNFKLSKYFTK